MSEGFASSFCNDLAIADDRILLARNTLPIDARPELKFDLDLLARMGNQLDEALIAARKHARLLLAGHHRFFPLSPVFCDIALLEPLGMGRRETAVTQLLAWMVSNQQAHGFGDAMLEALNATGAAQSSVQMIDSTIVRAHQHASGGKRGLETRILGALAVARRPRSI